MPPGERVLGNNIKIMKLIQTKDSKYNYTRKYIYSLEDKKLEYVYVDNGTKKDIICVPSQTGCKMGCMFCHLTARNDLKVFQVSLQQNIQAITEILADRKIHRELLISFMGAGEPLLSYDTVIATAITVREHSTHRKTRFGLATIIPDLKLLDKLIKEINLYRLDFKIHWSLHTLDLDSRSKFMPKASQELDAIAQKLLEYNNNVKDVWNSNRVEIHYTVFDGNDTEKDAYNLVAFLMKYPIHLKFINFSPVPDKALVKSKNYARFIEIIRQSGVSFEEYTPPGGDINGACGQFEERSKPEEHPMQETVSTETKETTPTETKETEQNEIWFGSFIEALKLAEGTELRVAIFDHPTDLSYSRYYLVGNKLKIDNGDSFGGIEISMAIAKARIYKQQPAFIVEMPFWQLITYLNSNGGEVKAKDQYFSIRDGKLKVSADEQIWENYDHNIDLNSMVSVTIPVKKGSPKSKWIALTCDEVKKLRNA